MLTIQKIKEVSTERLDKWKKVIVEHECTPFALVSIHHHNKKGDIHLCIREDVRMSTVLAIMKDVVKVIEKL